jgi:iron complex transport system substrate-binding protein
MKQLCGIVVFSLALHACIPGGQGRIGLHDWKTVPNEHATCFQILERGADKILLVFGPGGRGDTLGMHVIGEDAIHGLQPLPRLQRIVTATTTHLPYIAALGREEVVVGAALLPEISHDAIRQRVADGHVREVGTADGLDREQLMVLKPDVILDHPFNKELSTTIMDIPVIHITEYLEDHPLGRAEWLRVFGMLLGVEERAEALYAGIAQRYQELASKEPQDEKRPKVFFCSAWQGQWFAPPAGSYMATLINDAGAEYVLKDAEASGNITMDLEKVLHKTRRADHFGMILSTTRPVDARVLCAGEERLLGVPAVTQGGFYGNSAESDLFGQALLEPDACLRDLRRIFHPEEADTLPSRYFHPLIGKAKDVPTASPSTPAR